MKSRSVSAIIVSFILAGTAILPVAHAGEWNQKTRIIFNEPIEIPGQVLPAGTYWFVLQNNQSDRNIVEIFTADWSRLKAIVQTVPTYRQHWTDHTEVELAERPHNKPEALLKWYYPGQVTGHEFLYSTRHEKEFAQDAKQRVG